MHKNILIYKIYNFHDLWNMYACANFIGDSELLSLSLMISVTIIV